MVTDPLISQVVADRYRILEVIAEGGMGKIYKALQLALHRHVAIKVMLPRLAKDEDFARRFELEAQVISVLKSPHTLAAFDHGRLPDGSLYLVTEYLEGESLADVMRAGRMDPMRVLRMMREVCLSLDEAHSLGITHRDIKPQNIFLQRVRGREIAKVLDFGIARIRGPQGEVLAGATPTNTGAFLGTPRYAAPEQFHTGAVPQSDLFSLGIVAYECLTAQLPDRSKSQSMTAAGIRIDPRIDALVSRLLSMDPAERPASAQALMREIEAIESRVPSGKRRRSLRAPAFASLAVLAVGGAVSLVGREPSEQIAVESIPEQATATATAPPRTREAKKPERRAPPARRARRSPAVRNLVAGDNWSDRAAVAATFELFEKRIQRCVERADLARPIKVEVSVAHRTEVTATPKSAASDRFLDCAAATLRIAVWPERRRPHEPGTFRFEVGG
jgi:serine/threonine-protein kinase